MLRLFGSVTPGLLDDAEQLELRTLAGRLTDWSDAAAAPVVEEFLVARRKGRSVDAATTGAWLLSHPNDTQAVLDCMSVDPPAEIRILRLLSRAGSQKLVFLATWRLTLRKVVLKRPLPPQEQAAEVLSRESQTHPLSLSHPNIIETFLIPNATGEVFLVEEHLPVILSDDYHVQGVEEAANLLFDVANALAYLHDTLQLVHGDVKPDNIGKRRENYVLLDFGICRPRDQFLSATPTGSLRTRAPELLLDAAYADPNKVDVWALCATVFNAFAGRFPLLEGGEDPPRVSEPERRAAFIPVLAARARDEYTKRVNLELVPDPLRDVLERGLEPAPARRATARDLRDLAASTLALYLRASVSSLGATFSPREEVAQYQTEYGADAARLRFMPWPTRQAFRARLTNLVSFPYLAEEQIAFVNRMIEALDA